MYEDVFVTVVTCVYNTPMEYLKEAAQSVFTQTHRAFEYIIVDDHSDQDLFKDQIFSDERVTVIRLPQNSGPSAARNAAFDRAKGKYIAVMDSDDISLPNRLEKQIAFMEEHPDVVACGTWFSQFGDKQNEVKRVIDDNEYYRACLLFGNVPTLLNPSVMLRRATLEEYHIRLDERLRKGEDYQMWVQLSQLGRCTNIHENLLRYRVHTSQASQRLKTKDVSPYDWIVMKGQYDAMGLLLTKEEEALLKKDFRSKEIDAYRYWQLLNKILTANKESRFFVPDKLARRVDEQWTQKVFNTSAKELISLFRKLPIQERKRIVCIEKDRLLRKVGITWNKRKPEES